MRRSRKKRRAADAAEAAAVMEKLKTAGVYDGTATPQTVAARDGRALRRGPVGHRADEPPISADVKPPISRADAAPSRAPRASGRLDLVAELEALVGVALARVREPVGARR